MARSSLAKTARAFGYVRVSTADQARSGLGLEAQETDVRACVARHGLSLVRVRADEGVSGAAPPSERPGLGALLGELARGDVLIVAKRDRLGRDALETGLLERTLSRRGIRVLSAAGEGTEGDDPGSVLQRRIADAFAEHERLVIGSRTRAALTAKKDRGERLGAPRYGFRVRRGRIERDPAEQRVIAFIKERSRAGMTVREIAAALCEEGFVNRHGNEFGKTQVHRLMSRAST